MVSSPRTVATWNREVADHVPFEKWFLTPPEGPLRAKSSLELLDGGMIVATCNRPGPPFGTNIPAFEPANNSREGSARQTECAT
jgi:hypothetical protein